MLRFLARITLFSILMLSLSQSVFAEYFQCIIGDFTTPQTTTDCVNRAALYKATQIEGANTQIQKFNPVEDYREIRAQRELKRLAKAAFVVNVTRCIHTCPQK